MATDLPIWRCANPRCPARAHGAARVLLEGLLMPGSVARPLKCPSCNYRTTIALDRAGHPTYRCSPPAGGRLDAAGHAG